MPNAGVLTVVYIQALKEVYSIQNQVVPLYPSYSLYPSQSLYPFKSVLFLKYFSYLKIILVGHSETSSTNFLGISYLPLIDKNLGAQNQHFLCSWPKCWVSNAQPDTLGSAAPG